MKEKETTLKAKECIDIRLFQMRINPVLKNIKFLNHQILLLLQLLTFAKIMLLSNLIYQSIVSTVICIVILTH